MASYWTLTQAVEAAIQLDKLHIDLKTLDDFNELTTRYKTKPPKGIEAYLKSVTKEIGHLRTRVKKAKPLQIQ